MWKTMNTKATIFFYLSPIYSKPKTNYKLLVSSEVQYTSSGECSDLIPKHSDVNHDLAVAENNVHDVKHSFKDKIPQLHWNQLRVTPHHSKKKVQCPVLRMHYSANVFCNVSKQASHFDYVAFLNMQQWFWASSFDDDVCFNIKCHQSYDVWTSKV